MSGYFILTEPPFQLCVGEYVPRDTDSSSLSTSACSFKCLLSHVLWRSRLGFYFSDIAPSAFLEITSTTALLQGNNAHHNIWLELVKIWILRLIFEVKTNKHRNCTWKANSQHTHTHTHSDVSNILRNQVSSLPSHGNRVSDLLLNTHIDSNSRGTRDHTVPNIIRKVCASFKCKDISNSERFTENSDLTWSHWHFVPGGNRVSNHLLPMFEIVLPFRFTKRKQ
jgi:hypothetical protein